MKQTKKNLAGILLTLCLLMLGSISVFAASTDPSMNGSLTTTADKYSITVSWSAGDNATSYNVYYSSDSTNYTLFTTTTELSCTVTGLTPKTSYSFRVTAVNETGESSYRSAYERTLSNDPEVSSVAVASATGDSVTLEIAGTNAVAYNVYRCAYREYEYTLVGQAAMAAGQYTVPGLAQGTKYSFKVEAVNAEGFVSSSSQTVEGRTVVTAVTGLYLDRFYHYIEQAEIQWDSLSGADAYEYILCDMKGKQIDSQVVTTNQVSSSVKANTVYTAKVRALQKDASGAVTAATEYAEILVFEQPWMKSAKVVSTKNEKTGKTTNKLSIKWNKQSGASGYEVYVSTKQSSGYKKVKSVGKNTTSISLTKFKGKKIKKNQKFYVYIVSKVKYKGSVSRSGLVYVWKTGSGSSESYF